MARIIVTEFVSLDGVMEDPGGSEDFKYGGWTFEFDRGDEGNALQARRDDAADALLLGRKTYEGFAEAWPSREGEFADKFNSMPKYVVSSTLDLARLAEHNGPPRRPGRAVAKLRDEADGDDRRPRERPARRRRCVEHGLVDELRLMVFPVVLGSGKRLFGETSDKKSLQLAESRTVGDGVQILVYRPQA